MLKKDAMNKVVAALTLSTLGLIAQPTTAADSNWYLGAGAGRAESDISSGDTVGALQGIGATGVSASVDDDDTAYKLTVGYEYNSNFSIEAGYVDFGETEVNASGSLSGVPFTADAESDSYGLTLAAVGKWNIGNNFSLLGKVGAFYWDADIDATATALGISASVDDSDDDVDFFYGVGAQYDFDQFALRAEYEVYNNVLEEDIDVYTLNLLYRF